MRIFREGYLRENQTFTPVYLAGFSSFNQLFSLLPDHKKTFFFLLFFKGPKIFFKREEKINSVLFFANKNVCHSLEINPGEEKNHQAVIFYGLEVQIAWHFKVSIKPDCENASFFFCFFFPPFL